MEEGIKKKEKREIKKTCKVTLVRAHGFALYTRRILKDRRRILKQLYAFELIASTY